MRPEMADFLLKTLNLRRGEVLPVLYSAAFFFCVLAALMVLRPARDALGMQRGIDEVRWLFFGTAFVTLMFNPLFGWLVSRYRRLQFLGVSYGFFAASLIGFYGLLVYAPAAVGERSGQVFYVWFSVFNFFATMLFWALMADRYTLEQSKRFFPLVAAGGTLGAMVGPWLASTLAAPLGTAALLLIAVGFLLLAMVAAIAVARSQKHSPAPAGERETPIDAVIGGSAWDGILKVLRSPYLLGISAYVLILSVMVTFLYFTRLQMVAGLETGLDERTTWLARIDLYTQIATLALQTVLAGHLIRRIGMPLTLALLPATAALGFIGLAVVGSITALILFEAVFRAVQRAVMRPARETLFTVVARSEKYKAKAVIDTFVYRVGDVIGAQTEGMLGRLGLGLYALAGAAVPLALLWAALGVWLGRTQQRQSERQRQQSP
jgi:ATP:ADP antiporter, AAA family